MRSTTHGGVPHPKVPLAIDLWRRHAKAIEAHLAFRGLNIADWHQGTRDDRGRLILSSRRLLVLCEHIPEVGGRWPISLRMAKETHKEIALHRAALYVGGPHEYTPVLFLDPAEAREMVDDQRDDSEQMEQAAGQMYAGLGFT